MIENATSFERYLKLIGVEAATPSLAALTLLVRGHLWNVPFENISKLRRWKSSGSRTFPELSEFLDGIQENHVGGTCYAINYHLHNLLEFLGYDVSLCGAAMSQPDVHLVNLVKLDGREFIVDAGYAAPFLEPLPRDLPEDYMLLHGNARYVLKPQDPRGWSDLELYRNGTLAHRYSINPAPRRMAEFTQVIADSYKEGATFMNALLVARFGVHQSVILHNRELLTMEGQVVRSVQMRNLEELVETIHAVFGIPTAMSRSALEGLSFEGNAWT